jgi:hypothetical protein
MGARGGTRGRMDDECIGSGYNVEAVVDGETDARDNGKTNRGDGDDSGDDAGVTSRSSMSSHPSARSTLNMLNTLSPLSNHYRPSGNRPAISTGLKTYVRLASCVTSPSRRLRP